MDLSDKTKSKKWIWGTVASIVIVAVAVISIFLIGKDPDGGIGDVTTAESETIDTSDSITSEPITTEPVTTAPVTTEPVTTAPITTEPVTTAPVTTEPVTTAPVTTEPVTTAPVTTEPVTTAPVTTEPVTTAPVTTEPVTTAPVTTEPVTTAPATTEPVTTAPATTEPVTTAPEETLDPSVNWELIDAMNDGLNKALAELELPATGQGEKAPEFLNELEKANGCDMLAFYEDENSPGAIFWVYAPDLYSIAKEIDSKGTYSSEKELLSAINEAVKNAEPVGKQLYVSFTKTDDGYAPQLTSEFLDALYGGIFRLLDDMIKTQQ